MGKILTGCPCCGVPPCCTPCDDLIISLGILDGALSRPSGSGGPWTGTLNPVYICGASPLHPEWTASVVLHDDCSTFDRTPNFTDVTYRMDYTIVGPSGCVAVYTGRLYANGLGSCDPFLLHGSVAFSGLATSGADSCCHRNPGSGLADSYGPFDITENCNPSGLCCPSGSDAVPSGIPYSVTPLVEGGGTGTYYPCECCGSVGSTGIAHTGVAVEGYGNCSSLIGVAGSSRCWGADVSLCSSGSLCDDLRLYILCTREDGGVNREWKYALYGCNNVNAGFTGPFSFDPQPTGGEGYGACWPFCLEADARLSDSLSPPVSGSPCCTSFGGFSEVHIEIGECSSDPSGGVPSCTSPSGVQQDIYSIAGTYTWTAPYDTRVLMSCIGGGGGGGGSSGLTAGGGGGGGAEAFKWASSFATAYAVASGNSLDIRVGASGTGGAGASNGLDGTSSYVKDGGTTLCEADFGRGASFAGGAGGVASSCIGTHKYNGFSGGDGYVMGSGGGGGGGSPDLEGGDGTAASGGSPNGGGPASDGLPPPLGLPGHGGGGAGGAGVSGPNHAGSDGSAGEVIIYFC